MLVKSWNFLSKILSTQVYPNNTDSLKLGVYLYKLRNFYWLVFFNHFAQSLLATRFGVFYMRSEISKSAEEEATTKILRHKESLVPAFLSVKGLVKLHIDSFNHFIETEIRNIVQANSRVSVPSFNWWLEYNNVYIKTPTVNDGSVVASRVTPHDCRLRDLTYAGEILVDITFTRQHEIVSKKGVFIGRMPIMLKSSACVLNGGLLYNVLLTTNF